MTKRLRVRRKRKFSPHHVLLGAASAALQDAEEKRPGFFYYELTCITFSALALEAICNAFGEKFIPRWKDDFENAGPIAKLRLLSQRFDIVPDFGKDPWATALWLVKFRNRVAHAKPEIITEDNVLTRDEYENLRAQCPESKLDKEVSLTNARRAFNQVRDIQVILCERIPSDELSNLHADGWSTKVGIYQEDILSNP